MPRDCQLIEIGTRRQNSQDINLQCALPAQCHISGDRQHTGRACSSRPQDTVVRQRTSPYVQGAKARDRSRVREPSRSHES